MVAATIEGAAQVAEEQPLQQEDQHDADQHVVQHGARGDVDQLASGRRSCSSRTPGGRMPALLIFSTSASTRRMVGRLFVAAAHQHDALHDVVVVVLAGDAEPRLVADVDASRRR